MIFLKENVLKHVDKMIVDLNFPEQIGSLQELKEVITQAINYSTSKDRLEQLYFSLNEKRLILSIDEQNLGTFYSEESDMPIIWSEIEDFVPSPHEDDQYIYVSTVYETIIISDKLKPLLVGLFLDISSVLPVNYIRSFKHECK